MNWLRNFMYGRHGADHLSVGLIAISFLISLVLRFVPVPFILLIAYIPLVFAFYRILSKNISKRQHENQIFLQYFSPVAEWCKKKYSHLKQMQTHKFYKCPNCRQELRVPRGRGKIEISCPKCKTNFIKKT